MSHKLLYLISFVLLLGMAGNALAVDTDWNNASGDRRWDNPLNWSTGAVPTADDKASIRNDGVGPIIDSITAAVCDNIPVGDWGHTNTLDITGGSLTTNNWFIIGYGGNDEGTFNVSGGTTTVVGGGTDMTVGRSGIGHLNISAGSIEVGDRLYVGREPSGTGYINMTGGLITIIDDLYAEDGTTYINVSGGVIDIGERIFLGNGTGGEAHLTMTGGSITLGQLMAIGRDGASGEVHLDGGTLDIGYWLEMSSRASIDITGGTLIIAMDDITDDNGTYRSIQPWIDDGRISAYGGLGTLIVDYNTNPGKTTLTTVMLEASEPEPEHEETGVSRTAVLNWTPGDHAPAVDGHTVYFSEVFEDVNDGIGGITQSAASYAPPQRLDFETTYYWRVDEVSAPPDSTVYPGRVWSFTTEPVGYPIANITATASSSAQGQGPENTVNGSGLTDDLHSTETETMWMSDILAPQPAWIQFEFDKVYKLHEVWVWNSNTGMEGSIGYGARDVSIEYSADGNDYAPLGTTHEFTQAPGAPDYAHNTTVDFGGALAKHVRFTINTAWGTWLPQSGLSEVRFFSIPLSAREPSPDSGAAGVDVDLVLGWRAGREAVTHNVYLSTDEQAVIDGTAAAVSVTDASYSSPDLDLASTYYWRIDEVNEAETPTTWQGDVWSFTTQEYLVVEDFEAYNDINEGEPGSNRVYLTWIDGFGTTTNGAVAGNLDVPLMSQGRSGGQAMPVSYDNAGKTSEVTRTLDFPTDWTANGVTKLLLWFQGASANAADRMFVALGNAVVYHDDPAATQIAGWNEWVIDLQEFANQGVDLTNVTTITIGFGTKGSPAAGGTGTMYFDDIRLIR